MNHSVKNGRHYYRAWLLISLFFAIGADALWCASLTMLNNDLQGTLHLTKDQLGQLEVIYTAGKLFGWLAIGAILRLINRSRCYRSLLVIYALASLAMMVTNAQTIFGLRLVQGVCAGALLSLAQAQLFQQYPRRIQPMLQMGFAIVAVASTINLQTYLQALFVEANAWRELFIFPSSFALIALLIYPARTHANPSSELSKQFIRFIPRYSLLAAAIYSLSYLVQRGERWDWLNNYWLRWDIIAIFTFAFSFALIEYFSKVKLLRWKIFATTPFAFGVFVSLVAGFALFGSTYLIGIYTLSVMQMSFIAAGKAIVPGCLSFILCLYLAAYFIQYRHMNPIIAVPLGIGLIIFAVYLHSLQNNQSGWLDLLYPVLVRGAGMGFLLMALTMITFSAIKNAPMVDAIGVFSACRQLGGLIGIAVIESYASQFKIQAQSVINGYLTSGSAHLEQLQTTIVTAIQSAHPSFIQAQQLNQYLLNQAIQVRALTITYNNAFMIIAMMFVFAVPMIISVKIALAKLIKT
ncbi:MFS transporter [Celerinatantimonas diazotrophica]|uniref:DHA2 family multidrug resistance protein n=1 Tax=Celerinatantimonas diazotrophica TaxID=412034 RepID=A0A4R1J9Z6_9GAMM|nr:MFS transporter [Celerinatantimonas diazotrophica]TCK47455.1 DHA2 family multidrug resistance protein [Celerinatantimonas diazotrophica]CAG9294926.1 Colistin resistance protein EmrB [Celerinatantimonas diazotrophica]